MKRRAETLLRGAAVVLTLATVGWTAWWLQRGSDPVEYTNYEARLRVAVAANDVLDEEIVRAASGAAATFDGVDLAA